jgi:aspartate racemase
VRPVGILGGMGPEATVLLMQKVLSAVPARDDADHIPLVVHQNPQVPSRIARLIEGRGDDPEPALVAMARSLHSAGAQALAMPCNTAHAYAGGIVAACPLPFLDMREAALRGAAPGRIGMLASPAVRLTGVYDAHLARAGLSPVWPEDSRPLSLIRQIKSGDTGPDVRQGLRTLASELLQRADRLLVACTEFSLLTDELEGLPATDTLDALVGDIIAFARSR